MPSTSHPGRRALECARRSAAVARSSWRSARLSEQRKRSLPRPAYLRRPCGPASVRLHPPRVVPGPGARTAAGDGCPAQTQTHTTHSTPPTNAVRPQAWSSPNPNAREAPVSFSPLLPVSKVSGPGGGVRACATCACGGHLRRGESGDTRMQESNAVGRRAEVLGSGKSAIRSHEGRLG
jgi:hypothetical protein